jgi:DNA-binding CsgD family transcriptional regulator
VAAVPEQPAGSAGAAPPEIAAAVEGLNGSAGAVVILQRPSERILFASPRAAGLLDPAGGPVTGRLLSELVNPDTADFSGLVDGGHLNGFQQRRGRLHQAGHGPLELWVRTVGPPAGDTAVAVLAGPEETWPVPDRIHSTVVMGSVDRQLRVDRLSADLEGFLGYLPEQVLGRPLLDLVSPHRVVSLLYALAEATSLRRGVSLAIELLRPDGGGLGAQLMLVPLPAEPSFAFALQPTRHLSEELTDLDLRLLLRRFELGVAAAMAASELTMHRPGQATALAELSRRETQIVSRLMAGDRVPSIAGQLYLAQSTVRNHLSSVFAKLGVSSQQELIVLLRHARPAQD